MSWGGNEGQIIGLKKREREAAATRRELEDKIAEVGWSVRIRKARSTLRSVGVVTVLAVAGSLLPVGPAAHAKGMATAAGESKTKPPIPLLPPPPIPPAQHEAVPAAKDEVPMRQIALAVPHGASPEAKVDDLSERRVQDSEEASAYRLGGGTHLLDVTTVPQNFLAADGTWRDIDPTLVEAPGGFANAAGPAQAFFPTTLAPDTPVTLSLAEGTLALSPVGADASVEGKADGNTVTYAGALPSTDLRYTSLPDGYTEEAVLTEAPKADRLSWDVSAKGLVLRLEESGEISILAADQVVAVLNRPFAHDANVDKKTGEAARSDGFAYALTDLGGGAYALDVTFDTKWLADPARVYPVMIDPSPQVRDLRPSSDTHVYSCGNGNYSGDPEVRVGYPNSCGYRGLVNFDVSPYDKADRITYSAQLGLWKTFDDGSGDPVAVNRITSTWTPSTVTWPGPSVGTASVSTTGTQGSWQSWELGNFYQQILDGSTTDHGIRLGASHYHRFASNNTSIQGGQGHLILVFNDLPDATTLAGVANNATIEVESPTLKVSAMPTDYNGDDTWVKFEVASTVDFGDSIVASSPWLDSKSWPVDAGYLKDGQSYWWRAISGDVCHDDVSGDDLLCSATDADGTIHSRARSNVRKFTLSLPKYGTDGRWRMWSQSLGNGMSLNVNEANGNLFLDYPLDAVSTAAGPLGLSLDYNSQLPDNMGIGGGWNVGAGPFGDGMQVPMNLELLDEAAGDAVKIRFRDGDRAYFPHSGGRVYRAPGAGGGMVVQASGTSGTEDTWTYTTGNGSRYVFDAEGKLKRAKPSTDSDDHPAFDYVFTKDGSRIQIQSVKDPLNRTVSFGWTGAAGSKKLTSITTLWESPNRVWTLTYNGDRLSTVTDPKGDVVGFSYDGTLGTLSGIEDGERRADGGDGGAKVQIGYQSGSPIRVTSVAMPGTTDQTQFGYGPVLNGSIVSTGSVVDPRGVKTPLDALDYTTIASFNSAGLPVKVEGPYLVEGSQVVWPNSRMVWDTNGNLLCSRTPLAEAVSDGCFTGTTTGALDTDYVYNSRSPFQLLSVTGPAPNANGTGTRAITTYAYDEGFQGLQYPRFDNHDVSGVAVNQGVSNQVDFNWGSGRPSGITVTHDWSIRLSGEITAPNSRQWSMRLTSDDGSRLAIGNKTLVDCWTPLEQVVQTNCGLGKTTKYLEANKASKILIEYRHITGSNAQLKLEWQQQDGTWVVVPLTRLNPDTNLATTVTDPIGITTTAYTSDVAKLHALATSRTRSANGTAPRTTSFTYDEFGQVATATDAAGTVTSTYTENSTTSCLTQREDRTHAISTYECNTAGDVTKVKVTVPALAGTDQSTTQVRVVDATYDSLGRVLSSTVPHPEGVSANPPCTQPVPCTVTTYDHAGRVKMVTDPKGFVTSYTYDYQGQLLSETLPDPDLDPATGQNGTLNPSVIQHSYDEVGNENQTTDPLMKVWHATFDSLNRRATATDPLGNVTATTWSLAGRWTKVTDPAGVFTTTTSDILGRAVSEQLGNITGTRVFEYDPVGNVTKVTDPAGVWVQTTYDAFSEVVKETRPTGTNGAPVDTWYTYDDAGREISVKDGWEHVTAYTYDAEGRLLTSSLPASLGTTSFSYDAAGERVKAVDGSGRARYWAYDVRGRLISTRDASGTTTNTYDDDDRLLTEVLPIGLTRAYEYDALGRRIGRHGVRQGQTVDSESFTYDPAGHLATATGSGTTVALTYDYSGRIDTVTEGAQVTDYGYTASQLTSLATAAGTTSFTYRSADGLPATVTDPFSQTPTTYGYDAISGRPSTRTDPSGVTTTRTYEPASGRVASQVATRQGSTLAAFALTYDQVSNVKSKTATVAGAPVGENGLWSYNYDDANRLTSATDPGLIETTYGYDGAGNRTTQKIGTGPTVTTTYDAAGNPDFASDGTDYTVDAVGQFSGVTSSSRTWNYSYDSWGRVSSATGQGGSPNITFVFDALDRTLSRTKGTEVTSYAYLGVSEDFVQQSVGGSTTLFAVTPGGLLAQKQGQNVRYFLSDLHDDVVALVDQASGTLAGTRAFGAWGEPRGSSGEQAGIGYQGDPTDSDTGLVDMTTRLYDPLLGRFTKRDVLFGDPTKPSSLNQFVYGMDAALSFTDPTGMGPQCDAYGAQNDCGGVPGSQTYDDDAPHPGHPGPYASTPTVTATPFTINMSVKDFAVMSAGTRVAWIRWFMRTFDDPFNIATWFNAIIGVIRAAGADGLIKSGSWFSMVDAANLAAISGGMALAKGTLSSGGAPSAAIGWRDFYLYSADNPGDVDERRRRWAAAEQASVHQGVRVAAALGFSPTVAEAMITSGAELFRFGVRHPALIAVELKPLVDPRVESFAYLGTRAMYQLGSLQNALACGFVGLNPVLSMVPNSPCG